MDKCPGQDTRFWGPQDVSEAACLKCGYMVEFFKTDGSRRCPKCGIRVTNPKVRQGCALWCRYAKECLGFDPKSLTAINEQNDSIAERLIAAVKKEFGPDDRRISHALRVLDAAEEIMRSEGGEPRIVIAAALLHDIGIREAERKHGSAAPEFQEAEGPPIARRILEGLDFAERDIEEICRIVGAHHSGDPDTAEFRVIWDADQLVNLRENAERRGARGLAPSPADAGAVFKTAKAREMSRR